MRLSSEGGNMRSDEREGDENNVDVVVGDVGLVPHIIVEFFALFSRLEFALLTSGYSGGDVGKNTWVTWDRVASDLHKSFLAECIADEEVAILFYEPARFLVKNEAGDCKFIDGQIPQTPVQLLLQVRTVRNNLFHGSKVSFTGRDRQLVVAGIRVIRHLLEVLDKSACTRKIRSAWAYADVGVQ